MKHEKWLLALGLAVAVDLGASPLHAASIIDEWASVQAPPAPTLKPVAVDAKTTALLIFDLVKPFCNPERYTRCPAMLPAVKKLATEARAKGVMVVFTSVPPVPKTAIVDELIPTANDTFMQSWTDKFLNTDLEKILKDHGIATIIVTGLASNGAILETSSEAALKGFKVIVPLDLTTATTTYAEQFTAWQLATGPVISANITVTKSDMIKF
jgi:nicotinamidase-related amidase